MTHKLFFFAFLLMFAINTGSAQSVKPEFQELSFVEYHTVDSAGKTRIFIDDYTRINNDGIIRNIVSISLEATGNIGSDTSYKVADKTIAALNTIFNGQRTLQSHITSTKFPAGMHYAGPYECIFYSDKNGKTDHLMFTTAFLDKQLYNVMEDEVYRLPFARSRPQDPYRNKPLEEKIYNWYKACNCMPPIEQPPTIMSGPPPAGK